MSDKQSIVSELVPEAAGHESGSKEWAKAVANYLKGAIRHIGTPREQVLAVYRAFEEHEGWKHLRDRNRPLKSQDDFCKIYLGLSSDAVLNKLSRAEHAEMLALAPEIKPTLSHSDAGKLGGRGHKASDKGTGFPRGSNAAPTLIAKIKKVDPEIAEQIGPDKIYKSARAAARAAGIIKDKSLLQRAMDAYENLTAEDQDKFREREIERDSVELIVNLWHGLNDDDRNTVMERLGLGLQPRSDVSPPSSSINTEGAEQ
jgi:hypothetical protein